MSPIKVAQALVTVLVVFFLLVCILNAIFFVPWYINLIYNTHTLADLAATDNYISDDTMESMENIIKSSGLYVWSEVSIQGPGYSGRTQRGGLFEVAITASYHARGSGGILDFDIPFEVSYRLPTCGLRYYKDL